MASPQYEPIGRREKARPEVTELIERQKSRINSQNARKERVTVSNAEGIT